MAKIDQKHAPLRTCRLLDEINLLYGKTKRVCIFIRFFFLITIQLVRNGSAVRNICFTDDFSMAGKHIAIRRKLHVEERAAGFSVNCY